MSRSIALKVIIFAACLLFSLSSCRKAPPDAMVEPVEEEAPTTVTKESKDLGTANVHDSTQPSRSAPDERTDLNQETVKSDAADTTKTRAASQGQDAAKQGPPAKAKEATAEDTERGVAWSVPKRWPLVSEEDEFRVRTWRLPAVSMAGAGECALYRFAGGGDPQENLKRWMGEFRGPDGEVESVEAAQAQRTIQGVPAWLVRAEGQYVSQTPGVEDSKKTFDDYALFGAVVMAEGDPVFAKCVGPIEVIAQEADAILAWIDSLIVAPNE